MHDTNLDKTKPSAAKQLDGQILDMDHIAIAVENLDAAVQWYSTALGFSQMKRGVTSGDHSAMLYAVMNAGRATVVLVQGTSPESQVSRFLAHFGPGVSHIAFAVADLDEAIHRVMEAGGQIDSPVIAGKGIRQIFLTRDPATGVRVELVERKGGSFTDQNIERLFRALEEKELY